MKERAKFVIKRCFRFGEAVRQDVMSAMGVSEATATTILNTAVHFWGKHVHRQGNKIFPRPGSKPPEWASDKALLKELRDGAQFSECGLREKELPIFSVNWGVQSPPEEGAFTFICQSIAKFRIIDIHYVSLKKGDRGKYRPVFPLGLERKNDQWRLVAHDLSHKEYKIKTFQLTRILSVKHSEKPKPRNKKLGMISPVQAPKELSYLLNPELTEEQKIVVSNQLMWREGKIKRPARLFHEFDIEFAGAKVSDNIAWPLLLPAKK